MQPEGIIIIVATPQDFFDDEQAIESYAQPLPRITEQMAIVPRQRTETEQEIEQVFAAKAQRDAKKYRGKFLTYGWIQDRIEEIFDDYVTFILRHKVEEEQQHLIQTAVQAYLAQLDEDNVYHSSSPLHDKILRKALEDKRSEPPRNQDNKMAFHRRDLGVVSVLAICDISVEEAQDPVRLAEIHPLVDDYGEYYKFPESEVIWLRGQDTFSSH